MVILWRKKVESSSEEPCLQITAGAEGLAGTLAPTWGMVKGYKKGTLSIPRYLHTYHAMLHRRVSVYTARSLYKMADQAGGTLAFSCFCRDGDFCHTYYAVKFLVEHPKYGVGFTIHPDQLEFIEGCDWAGECWKYRDPVDRIWFPWLAEQVTSNSRRICQEGE